MDAELRIHLFGGLALFSGDTPLPPISSATARSLYAYLVAYRERPHTRDLLAGTFWPDLPESLARRRLSQALWQVRRGLEPHSLLLTDGHSVQCDPTCPLWCDVAQFTWHYSQAGGDAEQVFEHYQQCVDLYQGEFMAGYYDDWLLIERERLREMFLTALGQLVECCKRASDYERALLFARRLTNEIPWREEVHRKVMRLCHLLGRDAEALKQLELCRQALSEELGVEPSPETESLAAEIAARSDSVESFILPSAARPIIAPLLERSDQLSFIGRQSELAELLRRVEAAAAGNGGLTIVYGEAGVGKTRLLQELARNAQWRGVQTLWGRCYELSAPPAYQPLVEALRAGLPVLNQASLEPLWRAELSRLLPEIDRGESHPPALQPQEERRRLLEAITRACMALADVQPHLMILEDVHWMDAASLEALRYLLPRLLNAALHLVISVRSEELGGQPAIVLDALKGTHLPHRLDLERLNPSETSELVRCALGLAQDAPRFSARLFAETEGNPFFLLETLRMLVDEGLLYRDQGGVWRTPWDEFTQDYAKLPLSAGVAQSIERRLDRLSAPLKELVSLAAVIGRAVAFDVLLKASEWDERELLSAGDDLCTRGLFVAAAQDVDVDYIFAHDQIRRVAFQRLAAPRRRLYHRQVAQALTRLTSDEPETLAYHWTQAQVWDKAADYHQRAGERARDVFANVEAVAHYTQALQALERRSTPPDPICTFELLMAREDVHNLQGERAAQADDLDALEALAAQIGDGERRAQVALRQANYAFVTSDFPQSIVLAQTAIVHARLLQNVDCETESCLLWGRALFRQGNYQAAHNQFERSLSLARSVGLRKAESDSLNGLGSVSCNQGDYAKAARYFKQSLSIYREINDRYDEGLILNNLGVVFRSLGDYGNAKNYYEQALCIHNEVGDQRGVGMTLNNLGSACWRQGDYTQAKDCYEQSLCIKHEVDDQQGKGISYFNLGKVFHSLGDYPIAQSYYEQALSIYRETGARKDECWALCELGLIFHHLGDDLKSQQYCQQAIQITQDVSDPLGQCSALTFMGHAFVGLGQLEMATDVYQGALDIRRELGESDLTTEPLAGLARVSLMQGDQRRALTHIEEILTHLETGNLDGTDEPFRVYLTCYHVLQANNDPRAQDILLTAHNLLQERAARIEDESLQRSFLENVSIHRQIFAAYREWQTRSSSLQLVVSLPHADAPTGRLLRDDEYVTVTWTISTPKDREIANEARRRRHCLLRLLHEAREQGAAPTIVDLADALQVSQRTVKRDLVALRRDGCEVQTRGTRGK